jgi:arabinogalactan endo-1,4-beta-galactosidase
MKRALLLLIVQATPFGLGKGVFWWEAAVSGAHGGRGFFDADGNALPVMTVFDRFTRH